MGFEPSSYLTLQTPAGSKPQLYAPSVCQTSSGRGPINQEAEVRKTWQRETKIRLPEHARWSGGSLSLRPVFAPSARIDPALIHIQQTCRREQLANKPLVTISEAQLIAWAQRAVLQRRCRYYSSSVEKVWFICFAQAACSPESSRKHNYSCRHKSGNPARGWKDDHSLNHRAVTSRFNFCLRMTCVSQLFFGVPFNYEGQIAALCLFRFYVVSHAMCTFPFYINSR